MTLLLDIAPPVAPISPDTPGALVYQRFQHEPDTLAIAVVDSADRPVGLVERNAFLVLMAAQYGYALWSKRPALHMMKRRPVIVDGDVTVAEFCGRMLADRPADLLDSFIVTCAGCYAGVGTTLALLQPPRRPRPLTRRRCGAWLVRPMRRWPPRAASSR